MQLNDQFLDIKNQDQIKHKYCEESLSIIKNVISPVSGFEPPYEPEFWNRPGIIDGITCYPYALNLQYKKANKDDKLYVGKVSGEHWKNVNIINFIEFLSSDVKLLGRTIEPIGFNDKCPYQTYKIAVFIAPNWRNKNDTTTYSDYHFYRQNPDGTWSHCFEGKVSNLDSSSEIIINPEQAAKDYPKVFKYTKFMGYYAVEASDIKEYQGI